MAYPTATLADYTNATRRLLHDPDGQYWPDVTPYINEAIQQRDQDTGQNREIISLTLVVGTDTYTLSDLPNTRVFDVVGINLLYGNTRVVLNNQSYTDLNATWRAFTGTQTMPWSWAKYNSTTIIFGPKPGFAYETEWDCAIISEELEDDADADVLTGTLTKPVPFYAAYLAKQNERQYGEAEWFLKQYQERIAAFQGSRAGLLPSAYSNVR